MAPVVVVAAVIVAVIIGIFVFLNFVPIPLWISAIASGVKIGIFDLVFMKLRRVPPHGIVLPMIKAVKAGLPVSVDKLEAHYLAGGNVDRVVDALIAAHRAEIKLTFERGQRLTCETKRLEGYSNECQPQSDETLSSSAVAKNSIEVKGKVRVTVRANIDRLVRRRRRSDGCARGREVLVTSGSAESHAEVLGTPDRISSTVLAEPGRRDRSKLSIDIADVDVGRNIVISSRSISRLELAEHHSGKAAGGDLLHRLEQEMKAEEEMRAQWSK